MFDHSAAFERYRLRVAASLPDGALKKVTIAAISSTLARLHGDSDSAGNAGVKATPGAKCPTSVGLPLARN